MVCNTGAGLTPSVDDEVRLFNEQGLYNGLFLMADDKTGTYWNHMTGEAVYGPEVGKRLEVHNVRHTTVAQILTEDPETRVALSEHQRAQRGRGPLSAILSGFQRLSRMFLNTIDKQDERRPTMDLGLGIWDGSTQRYYAHETIMAQNKAVLDSFGGRTILVYYDPVGFSPMAQYVGADRVSWVDDVLHLSSGEYIEDGVTHAADGSRVDVERPLQVFTRWYGFSQTFPDTELYGEEPAR